ncbi:hypothetical protein Rhe02_16980 [Rhizocola hellebori]|uniref:Uncharacterized protein n=1 Tax=Rhizocola hellebori TaxID=1392758 RepID=A0A8J3Q4N0_9ACTN|nr:hypothetical protein [Rhizocola hellebori]GIH03631.1 hypothetical protein Rhe02_16980 [Rhizocola hellebori]
MASHHLIETFLAGLARCRLPADALDELADGLAETYHHHLGTGLSPQDAAARALAEFGTTKEINAAFARHSPARRAARLMLVTGPAVGMCWGASLVAARFWTWPIPRPAVIAFVASLLATIAVLAAAATSNTYSRTRIAVMGACAMSLLDLIMLFSIGYAAPGFVWPMALAVPASIARVGLTLRQLPMLVAR